MELLNKKIRKSGFEDAFFVIAVLLTIAIFILVLSKAWSDIRPELETSIQGSLPEDSGINVTENFNNITSTVLLFDKLFPFVLLGLFAFVFIGVALYINHPIMIFVGLIVLAVAVLLAVIYANIYNEISSSDEFAETNANFPIMEQFMKFLPIIIIIMFIGIVAGIIYSRSGGTSGL